MEREVIAIETGHDSGRLHQKLSNIFLYSRSEVRSTVRTLQIFTAGNISLPRRTQ